MDMTFTARFVHTGYHIQSLEGDRSMSDLIASIMPKGSIIEVTVKAKTTGESRGFCEFETKDGKYSYKCGNVLDADGKCSTDKHNTAVEVSNLTIGQQALSNG